ncbi:MAG: hypothetical protein HY289_06245 [Planctomycetes bacterium]|nr:hypothetical protein [Planctomycetota bacterium]
MHIRYRNLGTALLFLGAGLWFAGCRSDDKGAEQKPEAKAAEPKSEPRVKAGDFELSGPFTHENLTIFLVHGEDKLKDRKFVLLAEAMEKKLIVIEETKEVNSLKMENVSTSDEVLLLSGDILKGGQQDRVVQYDQFVPAKSGKMPLTVFCVEHTADRWKEASTDKNRLFIASPGCISSNEIRLSNRKNGNQHEVWTNVEKSQKALSMNAGTDVQAKESKSSLALSQDAKEVKAATEKYVAKLMPLADGKSDVVGFAFAINGKVYTADIYGSPAVFKKVWPRLINASAVEAFAEMKKDAKFDLATADMVKNFLDDANKGQADEKVVRKGVVHQVCNSGKCSIRFETLASPALPSGAAGHAKKDSIRTNYLAH